jgi:hypothetical protein
MDFESVNSLSIDDSRMSFGEVLHLIRCNDLDLKPKYKVGLFWDHIKKSRFIESALLGLPLNGFVFDEDEYGYYKIVDGAERLWSVLSYFNDEYKLEGLTILRELNGFSVSDLPYRNQIKLKRAVFSVTVLGRGSSSELKCELYKRINIGKYGFEPQEARNYAYPGSHEFLLDLKDKIGGLLNFRITTQSHGKRKLRMSLKEEHFLLCLCFIQKENFKFKGSERYITVGSALDYTAKELNDEVIDDYEIKEIQKIISKYTVDELNLVNRSYKNKDRYNNNEMSMNDFLKIFFMNKYHCNSINIDIQFNFFDENLQLSKLGKYV